MQYKAIQRIVGMLIMLFSFTMIPPVIVDLFYADYGKTAFIYSFITLLISGMVIWLPVQNSYTDLRLRDGFMIVVIFWVVLGVAGAMPFVYDDHIDVSFTDAVFESISGLTTTGATILVGIDELPHSLLYYRQQLQLLGGMGIIVLAVAVMPMLGVGGMQLYRAETPGPVKDSKLTPRIAETAKSLWLIYMGLVVACTLAYYMAGMSFFDAMCHSFSTISNGGFSTHDASMAHFESHAVEFVAIVFMILGAANFALHFAVLRSGDLRNYFRDPEYRMYGIVLLLISVATVSALYFNMGFDFETSFRDGTFQAVSIMTTSGFTTTEYGLLHGFIPVLLIFSSFIGGCAGSTGGGIKVIRVLLLMKQGMRELLRLIHPSAQVVVKVGSHPVKDSVIDAVWGFFAAYVACFVIIMLLLMLDGYDQITAFSAVAATINNMGPGLGEVSQNFASLSDFAKWLMCFTMLLGRLEIFPILVLLMPAFWRK